MKKKNIYTSIIVLFAFIPIILLSFYAHPLADDYDYSIITRQLCEKGLFFLTPLGALFTTGRFWIVWQGLYSSAALMAMQPGIFGEQLYFLGALFIIASVFLGIRSLFSVLLVDFCNMEKESVLYPSLLTCFYVFNALPSPFQGIYWFNGAVNYMVFWGLLLLLISQVLKLSKTNSKNKLISLCISAFLLSGGNHISAFAGILVLFFFSCYSLYKKRILNCIPLPVSISGFLLNILSPGTKIRQASIGQVNRSFTFTIKKCGIYSIKYSFIAFTVDFILLLILLLPVIYKAINRINKKYFKINVLALLLLFDYCILSAMFCVPHYAMGSFGEPRVFNMIFATYIVLGIVTFSYFAGVMARYFPLKKSLPAFIKNRHIQFSSFIVLFMILVIIGGMNGYKGTTVVALKEIFIDKSAIQYSKQMNERISYVKDHPGEALAVSPITTYPRLLCDSDLSSNKDFYANKSFSEYYHLNSITVPDGEWKE